MTSCVLFYLRHEKMERIYCIGAVSSKSELKQEEDVYVQPRFQTAVVRPMEKPWCVRPECPAPQVDVYHAANSCLIT